MYAPRLFKVVGVKGFVKVIVAVRRNKYLPAGKSHYHGGVVKVARRPTELYYIADFKLVQRNFFCKRAYAFIVHKEVVKVFHARPGRCSVVRGKAKFVQSPPILLKS